MFFRIYGVLYIFIYHTYNIYTHIYTSVSLTGDLTSLAQLRLSLCIRLVAPLPAVRHASASASSSSHLASGSSLLRLVTTCGMSPLLLRLVTTCGMSHPSPLVCLHYSSCSLLQIVSIPDR
ncbi:unnamed protein product [Brassica oleracea]